MVGFSLNTKFGFLNSTSSLLVYFLTDTGLCFLKLPSVLGINIYSLFLYKSISNVGTCKLCLKPSFCVSKSIKLIFLRIYRKFDRGLTC